MQDYTTMIATTQYNADNAVYFNGNTGNLNANNKYNQYSVRPVLALGDSYIAITRSASFFSLLLDMYAAYYQCRKRKRNTSSAQRFEVNFEKELLRLTEEVYNREYIPRPSIVFVISIPNLREIQAAQFRDRIVQHLAYDYIYPVADRLFHPRTFACRKGMGTLAAVHNLADDIAGAAILYGDDCVVCKIDLQSFFMSIIKPLLSSQVADIIQKYCPKEMKDVLLYICRIIYESTPIDRAKRRCPLYCWNNLPTNKSLYNRPYWQGMAIGNITTQLGALIYTIQYLLFVSEECGLKLITNFTDDLAIVGQKHKILQAIPYIRDYAQKECGLTVHPRKFFMQHWTKGVHYLGFYIRRGQLYMDNRVVHNCKERLRHYIELAEYDPDYIFDKRDEFVSVVNSYFGLFLHAHSYNLRKSLCNTIISSPWGKVVEFKGYAKCCVKAQFKKRNIIRNNVRKQISLTSRIINKYQILSLCTQKSKTAA